MKLQQRKLSVLHWRCICMSSVRQESHKYVFLLAPPILLCLFCIVESAAYKTLIRKLDRQDWIPFHFDLVSFRMLWDNVRPYMN